MKKAIIGIFICLSAVFLMSHNVGALELTRDVFLVKSSQIYMSDSTNCLNNINGGTVIRNGCTGNGDYLSTLNFTFGSTDVLLGDFIQVWFYVGINAENNSSDVFVRNISVNNAFLDTVDISFESINSSTGILKITGRAAYDQSGTNSLQLFAPGGGALFLLYPSEYIGAGRMTHWRILPSVDYGNDIQSVVNAINNQTNYTQSLNNINDSIQDLNDSVEDRNEKEDEALDNISGQTPSDISTDGDTENQATTNLIGLFSSFISALSNITQAQNCNLTLNFPSYAGGTLNVNVCQYKDKAGNLISVFSSLTLIVFYIPLAIKLLSMIYNEIRSFTNG